MGTGSFFAVDALICGASVAIAIAWRSYPEAHAAFLQLALWSAIAGPFGAVIAAAIGASKWSQEPVWHDFGTSLEDQIASKHMKEIQHLRNELLDNRLRIEGASGVTPLTDALAKGGQKEKLDALNVIGRRFEPSLAHALRLATRDSDPSVRVLASTVIAKLQTKTTERLAAMRKAAAMSDGPEPWLALGEAELEYSASGLVTSSQAQDETSRALMCIEKALNVAPGNEPTRLRLAELLIETGQFQKALHVLHSDWIGASMQERARQLCEQARIELASERVPAITKGAARSARAS